MPWVKSRRSWLADYLFDRFRWFRRWSGGHWEKWHVDPCNSAMWFQMDCCSKPIDHRPPCCTMLYACENHEPNDQPPHN